MAKRIPFKDMPVGSFVFVPGGNFDALQAYVLRATTQLDGTWEVRSCHMVNEGTTQVPVWEAAQPGAKRAEPGVGVWRTA